MEVFEVKEFRAEIKFSKRMSIAAGCALDDIVITEA